MNTQKLVDLCTFTNGGAWNESEYVSSGLPVIKVSDLKNSVISTDNISYISKKSYKKYQKNELRTNDVIVATVGSHPSLESSAAGRSVVVTKLHKGYLLNQNAVCIRSNDPSILDQRFLGYLTKSQNFKHYIQNRGVGAANQMRIPIAAIKLFNFELPSLKIQKKIAKLLSNYDDLINNNIKRINLLQDYLRITYEEWFLRHRIKGKKLETDQSTGLPFGWRFQNIYQLYEIKYGKNLSTSLITDSGHYEVYGSSGIIGYYHQKNVSQKVVLITSRGNAGNIHRTYGESFVTNNSFIVKPKNKHLGLSFNLCHLKTLGFVNYCSGTAQPQLTNDAIKNIKILLPNTDLLIKYNDIAKPILELSDNLRSQNQKLKEVRDILLPHLMMGIIKIEKMDINI